MTVGHETSPEFAQAMGPVARELLGQPSEENKAKRELRWGTHGSMSVDLGKGTWFDHEANEGGGVLDFIRARKGLDKNAALDWLRDRGHLKASAAAPEKRRVVATYDYTDAEGVLQYQVVRYAPKTFMQRRPDGNGQWIFNMNGVRRVLYRLPGILAAGQSGEPVYLVEGEKAADALVGIGVAASCSPGGANKWQEEFGEWLNRADVVILPDADEPGRQHAVTVAAALRGKTKTVRILELPGLPAKGDPYDWVAAGGTAEQLEALASAVKPETPPAPSPAEYLSVEAWTAREFPAPVRLLGDLITTTTRAFLIGATGLGKTLLGVAIGTGMASGQGFLHWRCDRPARVLYVDGEMPGELVKVRVMDAMRRLGVKDLGGRMFIYCADTADAFAAIYPDVGIMGPLNTPEGQDCLFRLIKAIGGVDAVIFDNVMSLIAGDQKDELPWSETLPLIAGLTKRQIGQLWLDHAGHNTSRQYGSSTKAWRFDTVGVMTDLPEDQRVARQTGFRLSFDAPGKARRRTPDNWASFAPTVIRLVDDVWSGEGEDGQRQGSTVGKGRVAPSRLPFHAALLDALVVASVAPGTTTLEAWASECLRRGCIDQPEPNETGQDRSKRMTKFRTAKFDLLAAGWIGIDGKHVSNLTQSYSASGR